MEHTLRQKVEEELSKTFPKLETEGVVYPTVDREIVCMGKWRDGYICQYCNDMVFSAVWGSIDDKPCPTCGEIFLEYRSWMAYMVMTVNSVTTNLREKNFLDKWFGVSKERIIEIGGKELVIYSTTRMGHNVLKVKDTDIFQETKLDCTRSWEYPRATSNSFREYEYSLRHQTQLEYRAKWRLFKEYGRHGDYV